MLERKGEHSEFASDFVFMPCFACCFMTSCNTEHTHKFGEWITAREATCSSTYTIEALRDFTLEFRYMVSSESGYDHLEIYHNYDHAFLSL